MWPIKQQNVKSCASNTEYKSLNLLFNPSYGKFLRGTKHIFIFCMPFLHTDMTQVVEIILQVRQDVPILNCQYHGCSWPARSQGISNHDIDCVEPHVKCPRTFRVNWCQYASIALAPTSPPPLTKNQQVAEIYIWYICEILIWRDTHSLVKMVAADGGTSSYSPSVLMRIYTYVCVLALASNAYLWYGGVRRPSCMIILHIWIGLLRV